MTTFGANVKAMRKRRKLSQSQVAIALGLSVTTVSAWECDRSWPTHKHLWALASLYGTTVDQMFHGVNKGEK